MMNSYQTQPTESFLRDVAKVIYQHKGEFEGYVKNKQRLAAVKAIKEYTGGGLIESKEAFDLWSDGRLPNYIREDRQQKLERLARIPLVETLKSKISKLNEDELEDLLWKFSIDTLLTIDEHLNDEKSNT